jgi:hypothetical protein
MRQDFIDKSERKIQLQRHGNLSDANKTICPKKQCGKFVFDYFVLGTNGKLSYPAAEHKNWAANVTDGGRH